MVHHDLVEVASELFNGTGVQVTTSGVRYLGSAIGDADFLEASLQEKVKEWKLELETLAIFAQTEPHAAFTALTHGLRGKFSYVLRTIRSTERDVSVLDEFLEKCFLPALTGRTGFSTDELTLLRLPARLGGIGLPDFCRMSATEAQASRRMTENQVMEIILQSSPHDVPGFSTVHKEALKARNTTKSQRRKSEKERFRLLRVWSEIDSRRLELLSENGASSWLTTLPLREHGFFLSKRDFRDVLVLRYDWQVESVPIPCVCGAAFSADHALTCSFGGYPTVRHNEIRYFIADKLLEICHDVAVEPLLAPVRGEIFVSKSTNTSDQARSDVRERGFWSRCEDAYFDIRVFHPNATSYQTISPSDLFKTHERRKKLEYEERILNVDHGFFCPLVFSTTGAAGPLFDRFLCRLVSKLTEHDVTRSTRKSCHGFVADCHSL